ncbi:MAG: nitroreductase family protein [Phascolarctobacterium sp.]|nr:nitroreductase family protein [Phascolarctobacterium sp.]
MDALDCIMTRRSNRKFIDKPIEDEKLRALVEAGRQAPCGGNSQSCHFLVITNKEVLAELAKLVQEEFAKWDLFEGMYKSMANSVKFSKRGNYVFHYKAPALIVVANKKEYGNAMADSACATENILLAANALGLGACYINQLNWLDNDEIIRSFMMSLGLADDETMCTAVSVGYVEPLIQKVAERTGNAVTWVK